MSDIRSTKAEGRPNPTDMELMLYVDGELDEERIADVESFIKESEGARRKVSALRLASGMVREHTIATAKPIDIASAVMAKIEAGEASASEPPAKNGASAEIAPVKLPRAAKDSRPIALYVMAGRRSVRARRDPHRWPRDRARRSSCPSGLPRRRRASSPYCR